MDPKTPPNDVPDSDLPSDSAESTGFLSSGGEDHGSTSFVFEDDEAMLERYRRLKRRLLFSTLFSGAVVVLALVMMGSMIDDLRYWLQDDAAPEEVALVDVIDKPEGLSPWQDHFVALSATPDASRAVKISLGRDGEVTEKLRFFRLLEAGNRVFVQTDLPVGQDAGASGEFQMSGLSTKTLPGRFVGRVHRLGELRFYEELRDHYNAMARPQLLSIPKSEWQGLGAEHNLGRTLEVRDGDDSKTLTLQASDRFEVVTLAPECMLQMGTKTWPKAEDAIAKVKELGFPFIHIPYQATPLVGAKNPERVVQGVQKQLMHRFLLRAPQHRKTELLARLHEGIELPADNASLEVGAAVLPKRRIYSSKLDDLSVKENRLYVFPQSKVTSPGYDVVQGKLVERPWNAKGIEINLDEVQDIRVKRPVMATQNSLILLTGNLPSQQWPAALAFGILGLFVAGNLVMGRRFWRRYRELCEEDEQASADAPAS